MGVWSAVGLVGRCNEYACFGRWMSGRRYWDLELILVVETWMVAQGIRDEWERGG